MRRIILAGLAILAFGCGQETPSASVSPQVNAQTPALCKAILRCADYCNKNHPSTTLQGMPDQNLFMDNYNCLNSTASSVGF